MTGFLDEESDQVQEGNYELGHTSGYMRDEAGNYYYKYCIKNLSDQTMFEFKWKGPRPNSLIKGRVAYSQAHTEGWSTSSKSPEDNDERVLAIGNGGNYGTEVDIQTIFKSAAAEDRERIFTVQADRPDLNMESWSDFIQDLQGRQLEGAVYRRTAGVMFSIPSDQNDWETFIEGSETQPASPPIQMQVYLGLEYDLERSEIRLVSSVGLIPSDNLPGQLPDFFKEMRLEFPELERAGFETSSIGFESVDQPVVNLGPQYLGFRQSNQIAGLEDLLNDERPVPMIDVPITLTLFGQPIFEFTLEALGLPSDI